MSITHVPWVGNHRVCVYKQRRYSTFVLPYPVAPANISPCLSTVVSHSCNKHSPKQEYAYSEKPNYLSTASTTRLSLLFGRGPPSYERTATNEIRFSVKDVLIGWLVSAYLVEICFHTKDTWPWMVGRFLNDAVKMVSRRVTVKHFKLICQYPPVESEKNRKFCENR